MPHALATSHDGVDTTSSKVAPKQKRLTDQLLEMGYISPSQLDLALREKKRTGKYIGEAIVDLGFVSQKVISGLLAGFAEAEFVHLENIKISSQTLQKVSYSMARRYQVLPIAIHDVGLKVAMVDVYNVVAIDALEKATHMMIDVVAATEDDLMAALERNYARETPITTIVDQIMSRKDLSEEDLVAEESPLVRLVDQIIGLGVRNQATDIHIEPGVKTLRVRMRLDGIMHEELITPSSIQVALVARIKIMADMDVTEKRRPQDGRIQYQMAGKKVDLRVSSLPTQHGESIVMRLLDSSGDHPKLEALGFSEQAKQQFQKMIAAPHGIILVTGPTGSGKSTTLYAAMGELDTLHRSVFTLEDPIEYEMQGVRQTQIHDDVGMTFANGLRALLRQDPDVILVGEIRDQETAVLAVRAALTGHVVFSSLHTNDAVGAIPRLIDMGIEPFLLHAGLVGVVGQRLVRKLCQDCKQEVADAAQLLRDAGCQQPFTTGKAWRAVGCVECNHTGYRGRQGLYEVLMINDAFHDAMVNGANPSTILRVAREAGMQSMFEDGMDKVQQGSTTIEEVLRVVK